MKMPTLEDTVGLCQLFGEPTRVRLMALLGEHELSVADLTGILEIAQSRVSTHLGKLREAGLLRDRRVGTSTLYALNDGAMPGEARKVWTLLKTEIADAILESDRGRCAALVRARDKTAAWPDSIAGQMERHYSPGRTWESLARGLVGLVRMGDVLDAGSGDGAIAQLVASRARTVTLLDRSERVMAAARARLGRLSNVHFHVGDVEALPFADASFDHVLFFNILCSVNEPQRAIAEAGRVLGRGGNVVLVTLLAHAHHDVTAAYHHVHSGFSVASLRRMLHKAGLVIEQCDVTSRERHPPHFEVITAFAYKS